MTPPKPPRKSLLVKSTVTSPSEETEVIYEDPDALKPDVPDESQSAVTDKPVPRPRTKIQPKEQRKDTNNNPESVDSTISTANGEISPVSAYPEDYKRSHPVRPPPRPPSFRLTISESTAKAEEGTTNGRETSEAKLEPSAEGADRKPSSPRFKPKRPPPPAIYYDRISKSNSLRPKSESNADGYQVPRRWSSCSLPQTSISPAISEEDVNPFEATGRPAVPPRIGLSLARSASDSESTLQLIRQPPPPSFTPPPPPTETPSETIYSEIEYRPYVHVLPDDGHTMTRGRSTLGSTAGTTLNFPNGFYSSYKQTSDDTEDINAMLRWLLRMSKTELNAPSLYGLSLEEEIRSFNQRAMNVRKALRLYNLLMMKRNETLRDVIAEFNGICESLDKVHKMNKTMGIAGGTTGAVGGVTAVLGIALAPATLGASLIATAVGAGMVASAGGISAHTSKANRKVVNKMTIEKLVYDYKSNVVDLEHCLEFIFSEMNELRRHDIPRLQRAGAPSDAVKMANLSQSVFRMNDGKMASHAGGMSSERLLQAFMRELDQYFSDKDSQKLKKSNKSRFSGRICLLAKNLQSELDHLNRMWEMFS